MIPFICNLPIIGNCLKSDEYPKTLKKPFQVKISSIIGTQNLIKKIIGVALVVLILCVASVLPIALYFNTNISRTNSNQPPAYLPYLKNLKIKTVRDDPKPITHFPPYLITSIYPGMMSAENGRLCVIPENMPTFAECHKVSMDYEAEVKIHHPKTYIEATTDPEIVNRKGGTATKESGATIKKTYFGMDKRKVTAFQETLCYIEKEVLNSPYPFENAGNLVKSIKETNAYVTQYLNERPGELRDREALMLNGLAEINKEELRDIFYKQGGLQQDLKYFDSLFEKFGKYESLDKALNANEKNVLNRLGYTPCNPNEINSNLNKMAKQIIKLALAIKNQKVDAVAAAAFVHQELHKICPFKYGTGRTARIWMNILLQMGGYKAVMIPDHQAYFNEVVKDRKTPGTFTSYLKQVIEWNRRQINLK
jgi:fido (protein-threonine AMPylation protein)